MLYKPNATVLHMQMLHTLLGGHASVQPTTVRPHPSSVPPGVKDVFVWLTETPAPSDPLFQCAIPMLLLTYLFTYH